MNPPHPRGYAAALHFVKDVRITKASYGPAATRAQVIVEPESSYNESAVEATSRAKEFGKRQGSHPGGTSAAKVARLQAESAAGPSGGTSATHGDVTGSVPFEPPPYTSEPSGGELLLLTGHPGGRPEVRTSAPPIIPHQRPKVRAKKRLACCRPPPSPAIQFPLGEWPRDASGSGGLERSNPSTAPLGATAEAATLSHGPSSGADAVRGAMPPSTSLPLHEGRPKSERPPLR